MTSSSSLLMAFSIDVSFLVLKIIKVCKIPTNSLNRQRINSLIYKRKRKGPKEETWRKTQVTFLKPHPLRLVLTSVSIVLDVSGVSGVSEL